MSDSRIPPPGSGPILGYEILELLGSGGMGDVYRARQTNLGREVALKVMPDRALRDPSWLSRFRRETRIHIGLSHKNLVRVYDAGVSRGAIFLALEIVEGRTLFQIIREDGPQEIPASLQILRGLLDALAYLHERGVIHRDLKSANVMVDVAGQVKVLDFGIAKRDSDTLITVANEIVGTLAYMPPEMVSAGVVGAPGDVYSGGLIAYELLTGDLPYRGRGFDEWVDLIESVIPPPLVRHIPEIPRRLNDLVNVLLLKDPASRPTAARARDEIVRILVSLGLAEQSVKLSSHRLPLLDRAGEGVIRHDSLTFGNLPDPLNEGLQLTARTETVAGDPRAGVFPAADSASDSDISWASWESGLMSQLQKFHGGIILGLLAILFGSMGAFVLFMTFRDPPQRTEESPLAIEASPQTGAGRVDSLVLEEVRIVPVQGAVHVRFFTRTEKRFSLHVDPDGDPAMDDRATRWHQLYVKNPRSGRCRVRVLEITDGATVLPSYFWIDSPTSLELETRCLGVQGRLSQLTGVSLSNLVDVERLQSSEAEQDRCFWTGSGPGIIRDLLDRHIPAIDMGAIPIAGLIGTDSMVDRLTERMHSSAPWRQDTNARGDFANIIRLADALLRSGQPRALDAVREYILGGYASWNREHPQVLDYEGLRYWWRIMRRAARYRPALARELLGDLRRHSEQGWAYMLTCFPEEAIPALATIIRGPDHVIRTTTYRGLLDSGIPPELIRPIVDVSRRGSVPEIEQMGACPLLALRCGPSGLDGLESLARTARDAQPNQPIGLFYGIRHLGLNPAGGARLGQFSEAFDSPLVRIRNALDRAWVDRIANRVPPDAPIPVPPISTGLLDPGPDPDPAKVIADDPAGDRLLLAALMQSEAAIPRIRIALEHGNPYLRWVAALALGLTSRPVPVRDPMVHSSQDPEWAVLGAFFARPLETGERLQLLDPTMPGLDIGVTADPGDRVEIRWIGFSSGATPGPDDGGRFVLSQEGLARPEGGSRHIWFGLRCGSQKTILERESGYGFNPGWITISQGGPLIFMAGVRATWHPEDDWLYTTFNQIDETGCVLVRWKLLPGASPDQHRTRTPRSPRGHQRALSFDGQTRRPSQ